MHVLLIAPGVSVHSRRFLQMMKDAGHRVTYIDPGVSRLRREGNRLYVPYTSRYAWLNRVRLKRIWLRWFMAVRLRRIWRLCRPDVVHVHCLGDDSAFFCASAHIHPLVLTAWGSDINNYFPLEKQNPTRLAKIAYALNSADHVTSDTPELLARCEILAGRRLDTSLFYYGIDLAAFRPLPEAEVSRLRESMGVSAHTKVILSVRRIIPTMCHDRVIRAFSSILARSNLDVVLVFVESLVRDDTCVVQLKRLAQELGVAKRVRWLGELTHEQMPLVYGAADVVVNFPSRDGLPVTLFEAAACMKPTVTSDLEAYREFLAASGFFRVPKENTALLADAIESILVGRCPDIAGRLEANRELVLRKAEVKKCVRGIQQVYGRVLAQRAMRRTTAADSPSHEQQQGSSRDEAGRTDAHFQPTSCPA